MELFITFLAGFSIFVGVLIVKLFGNGKKEEIEHVSMAMALAALLSLLVLDLVPEVAESAEKSGWLLEIVMAVIGFVLLVILDRFVPEHEDNEDNHDAGNALHIGIIAALGIIVHNIVEGMTVYSVLFTNLHNGIILAIGIALHNLPMGMMIYSAMRPKKRSEKMVVFGLVTFSTLIGGFIMQAVSGHISEYISGALMAVAVGMIVYLVVMELLPHVLKTKGWVLNVIGAIIGFALVYASSLIGG